MLIGALQGDTAHLAAPVLGFAVWLRDPAALGGDSAVIASLKALAAQRGSNWPTKSVVGARGVRAVAALALRDPQLLRGALHRLMEAGPEESFPPDVATLEDYMRSTNGRGQLYGTQMEMNGKTAVPKRTEDLAHVDLRRDGAMLPPLETARCVAGR